MSNPNKSFIFRAHTILVALSVFYALILALTLTPLFQTHLVYAHRIFGYSKFDRPEDYGLAPGKTVNLQLRSSDNTRFGAWFIFSKPFYHTLSFPPSFTNASSLTIANKKHIPSALASNPTILFLHGNSGSRATASRIDFYMSLTSRLNANVLAIDYRGFADSEGHPSVQGVSQDARAGWNYLMAQGARPEDVVIVGHSLGTAIAGLLAAELGKEGIRPRGLALLAPFSSIRGLMERYYLFLPLMKPIMQIPGVSSSFFARFRFCHLLNAATGLLTWSLAHKFDTLTLVPHISTSVLMAHAADDWVIPDSHSTTLFNAFQGLHLHPHSFSKQLTIEEPPYFAKRVRRTNIERFGTLDEFAFNTKSVNGSMTAETKIALLKTPKGSHNIGRSEGVQDVISRMFELV